MAAVRSWLTCSPIFLSVVLVCLQMEPSEQDNMDNTEIVYGIMMNSCICKVDGKVYNLTETGKLYTGKSISFTQTRNSYYYLISICYPYNYPPVLGMFSSEQPRCQSSSLCQLDNYGTPGNLRYYKLVTNQNYKNGSITCYLNKTTGLVHWVYKGIPPLFTTGGLKLTLKCIGEKQEEGIIPVNDVDRRTGQNPWKFVTVKHKCCCADKCYVEQPPTRKPSKQAMGVYEEIGEFGGGFLVLVIIMIVGVKIANRFYNKQPAIKVVPRNYNSIGPHIPKVPVTIIDYTSIESIKKVGEGTFGVVSKGIWHQTPVAIKRFKDHVIEEDINAVTKEIIWLSKLRHMNIVQFYGICNLRPNICVVTEYMPKGSVATEIHEKRKILTWNTRIKWAVHAARGMVFLHANHPQIIHRDLKSYNLLVDENDVVKIADLGTIKLVSVDVLMPKSREVQEGESSRQNDTSWAGTLRWTAPEVIPERNQNKRIEYTSKCDVFSFAMTFWEMIYNRLPYHHCHWDKEIIDAILGGIRPDTEDSPPAVETLLESWWHINPDMRPEFDVILKQLESTTLRNAVISTKPSTF